MRKTYVFKDGVCQEKDLHAAPASSSAFLWSDIQGYHSPVGNGWIEGRNARREDLKRSGCREVAPDEYL